VNIVCFCPESPRFGCRLRNARRPLRWRLWSPFSTSWTRTLPNLGWCSTPATRYRHHQCHVAYRYGSESALYAINQTIDPLIIFLLPCDPNQSWQSCTGTGRIFQIPAPLFFIWLVRLRFVVIPITGTVLWWTFNLEDNGFNNSLTLFCAYFQRCWSRSRS